MQKDFSNALRSNRWLVGQMLDNSSAQIDTYIAESFIPFGSPVVLGTDPTKQVRSPLVGEAARYFGIAVREDKEMQGGVLSTSQADEFQVNMTSSLSGFPIGSVLCVARRGRIVIPAITTVIQAVVGTTRATFVISSGQYITQTATATANTVIDLGMVMSVPVVGQLCAIEINLIKASASSI